MIYFEFFLVAYVCVIVGVCIGVKLSIRVLNKKTFETLADNSLNSSIRQATAIQTMLGEEAYKMVMNRFNMPYDSKEIQEYIRRGINLN